MNTKIKLIFTLISMTLAGQVLAATLPPAVTGVIAQGLDGQVVVQWDSIDSEPIDYFRVYYSTESILENNGVYDDFESTKGNETTLSFVPPRGTQDMYVAVIAVKTDGSESPYFIEEAYVRVPTDPPVLKPEDVLPEPTERHPDLPEHTTLKVLKGTVTTPEEIVVEFSTAVTVDPEFAPQALRITKAGGIELAVQKILIEDKEIRITTNTQERGVVYQVAFREPFSGRNGQVLDEDDRAILVTGHPSGREPDKSSTEVTYVDEDNTPLPPTRESDPVHPPDVEDADLNAVFQDDGNYTVTITWTVDNSPKDLWKVLVYQTRDGRNFGPPTLLPLDIAGVELKGVTAGFYGLYIQVINVHGKVSKGVFSYTTLPVSGKGFTGQVSETQHVHAEAPSGLLELEAISDATTLTPMQFENATLHAAAPVQLHWTGAVLLVSSIVSSLGLMTFVFMLCAKQEGFVQV